MTTMTAEAFQALPKTEIAAIVRDAGPKVVVFALNGTRRWFLMEHDPMSSPVGREYLDAITVRLIELCGQFFDHGVDTLLVPLLSPYLFNSRGDGYANKMIAAMSYLTRHERAVDFYKTHNVRTRFYGDYASYLRDGEFAYLLDEFDETTHATLKHDGHRLLWGMCAHHSVETVARLSVEHHAKQGDIPTRDQLIEAYYGERLPDVNIFIGASKPRAFDMPLLSTGREDLYFTVAPSPSLTQLQIRDILYDHLFARPKLHSHYDEMSAADWEVLRGYYQRHAQTTLGVGFRQHQWGLWMPRLTFQADNVEPQLI